MGALDNEWPDPDLRDDALLRCLVAVHRYEPRYYLRPAELRILEALSHGVGEKGAAALVGESRETVHSCMKAARAVLGAKDSTEAVAEALRRGLIR